MMRAVLLLSAFSTAAATTVDTYWGNGCFFHQQHSLVNQLEKVKLRRAGSDITSVAGYAGGKAPAVPDELCYHNKDHVSDYGEQGHAEVVRLALDDLEDSLRSAATVFFEDFTELTPGQWTRQDVFDIGPEYRAIIGIPGGLQNEAAMVILEEVNAGVHKLTLKEGMGGDADTIDSGVVWIMDSDEFPAYQAEFCLQFHDDAPAYSQPYTQSYHGLAGELMDAGTLTNSTCPANFIC
jgi:peptide methionine sulfoxide reductase MsrA